MDELEARIAAIELVLIELMAELDPAALSLAKERIMGQVADVGQDEKAVRLTAAGYIEDAERRFQMFGAGMRKPGGD